MARPVDYSRWNHIEVSDDEDDTHPNIDKESLWRWKKQARLEREKREAEEKRKIQEEHARVKSKLIEARTELKDDQLAADLAAQEAAYAAKEAEIERMERLYPKWSSSNMCKDGFSKSVVNKAAFADAKPKTEQEDQKLQSEFFKKHGSEIREFGAIKTMEQSENYLLEHPHLLCEYTANYLIVRCVDLEVEEKKAEMLVCAHQCLTMQYIMEIAKTQGGRATPAMAKQYFVRIKAAAQEYKAAFDDEYKSLVERIEKRARERVQEAVAEYEAEEKAKRIAASPGGLDPEEVMESLPQSLKDAFASREVSALQEALLGMSVKDAKYHMDRCAKSGLWVPAPDSDEDANADPTSPAQQEGFDEDGQEIYEEVED